MNSYILTAAQIEYLLTLKDREEVSMELDLGKKSVMVQRLGACIRIGEAEVSVTETESIRLEADALYLADSQHGDIQKIQFYSEETGNYYRLVNCGNAMPPTVEISGIKMHVTKNQNPAIDTQNKLKSLGRIQGRVLDTCCGLGYTSIALAQIETVNTVFTCEIDPNMQTLCKLNPWSQQLYSNRKITIKSGDVAEIIRQFPDNFFHAIIHDPPRYALAPTLYSGDFYQQCFRVLSKKGKLYHYTGDPNQKTRKKSLQIKTIERLLEAGFSNARKSYQGVWAKR